MPSVKYSEELEDSSKHTFCGVAVLRAGSRELGGDGLVT